MRSNELRERSELACEDTSARARAHLVLKIFGGAVLAVAAFTLIASLGDIRRYIRITRM